MEFWSIVTGHNLAENLVHHLHRKQYTKHFSRDGELCY